MYRLGGLILLFLISIPLIDITLVDGWSLLTGEDFKIAFGGGLALASFTLLLLYIRKRSTKTNGKIKGS
jgi:hypothetical protein